jgi:hypothetical protein
MMSGIRVRVDASFDEMFNVLEVVAHPLLEVLLSISNVYFTSQVTSDLVDYDWVSAYITIRADATYRTAVAWSSDEVEGLHIFDHLGREVALEDVAHDSETMVGH